MKYLAIVSAALILGMTTTIASADFLTIDNPGFEDQVIVDGSFIEGKITGWKISNGIAGVYNPTTGQFPDEAPEGQNTTYSNGSVIIQVLSDVLEANTRYELTVCVAED